MVFEVYGLFLWFLSCIYRASAVGAAPNPSQGKNVDNGRSLVVVPVLMYPTGIRKSICPQNNKTESLQNSTSVKQQNSVSTQQRNSKTVTSVSQYFSQSVLQSVSTSVSQYFSQSVLQSVSASVSASVSQY